MIGSRGIATSIVCVAAIYAARARRDAVQYNRAGDYAAAAEALDATVQRIRRYAAGDPELDRIIAALKSEQPPGRAGPWSHF